MGNTSSKKKGRGRKDVTNKDRERFLAHISKKIGAEWMLVCVSLGVSQSEIDHINYDASLDVQTKIYRGLLRWRRQRQKASDDELLTELREALIENGRLDLVEHIESFAKESEARGSTATRTYNDGESTVLYSRSAADRSVLPGEVEDSEVVEFRNKLYTLNKNETKKIPVSPLQNTSTVSIQELYAPVSIREDLEYQGRGRYIGTQEKCTRAVNHPNEMFRIDGNMARNIFLLGDAGIGKSVYCLKLVENWCKGIDENLKDQNSDSWIEALKEFHYLYFVQLRHVNKSRTSVIEMIRDDVFKHNPECRDVIHRVISDVKYRCLIVIDGLDEWKISDEAKEKLTIDGLPNTEGMANCTFLWSMRPWVMEKISDTIRSNDRVVEVQGLDSNSIKIVIEKLLVNFYKQDKKSLQYKEKVKEITKKTQDSKLKSIIQKPLMAIACIQIWYEEKVVGNSMTSLYVALLDLLIKRSNTKSTLSTDIKDLFIKESLKITNLPQHIMRKKRIKEVISVMMKLGQIAYEDLISHETHLVFLEEDLEEYLEDYELEYALKTGLLSKCEAPGSCNEENVSLNFFHKSFQEFLAAIYIENSKKVSDLIEHLTSVEVIMDLGNVLIFLSGLNPMFGSTISKQIVNVADADTEICEYRIFRDLFYPRNKVELLYKLQVSCYREIEYSQSCTADSQQLVPYHVSDVNVNYRSDIEIIRTTTEILTHHSADIKSLYLFCVPSDVMDGITDSIVSQFLDQTMSLQSLLINETISIYEISDRFSSLSVLELFIITLTPNALRQLETVLQSNKVIQTLSLVCIKCKVNEDQDPEYASLRGLINIIPTLPRLSTLRIAILHKEDKSPFRNVLPSLSHLHGIRYYYTYPYDEEYDRDVVDTLCTWSGLRILELAQLNLGDIGLKPSHSMSCLEKILLFKVTMSPLGWRNFIQSVQRMQHEVSIDLQQVQIDQAILKEIRSCPQFKITKDRILGDKSLYLVFIRKRPVLKQYSK